MEVRAAGFDGQRVAGTGRAMTSPALVDWKTGKTVAMLLVPCLKAFGRAGETPTASVDLPNREWSSGAWVPGPVASTKRDSPGPSAAAAQPSTLMSDGRFGFAVSEGVNDGLLGDVGLEALVFLRKAGCLMHGLTRGAGVTCPRR